MICRARRMSASRTGRNAENLRRASLAFSALGLAMRSRSDSSSRVPAASAWAGSAFAASSAESQYVVPHASQIASNETLGSGSRRTLNSPVPRNVSQGQARGLVVMPHSLARGAGASMVRESLANAV